ncbi:hypothetical protein HDU76_012020, partial [Blyttiomyces sp. JEL0837]
NEDSEPSPTSYTSWEKIRGQNQDSASAWSKLRYGKPVQQQRGDDDDQDEDAGDKVKRGNVGGGIGVARTREEIEEMVRSGAVRTNKYGDPI